MRNTTPGALRPALVLGEMGIKAKSLRLIQRRLNTHWLVETPEQRLVLRRYSPRYSRQSVAFELQVLEFLAQRDWPVPAPVAPPLQIEDSIWCACRYLPGRVAAPRTMAGLRAEQHRRGRLMARLHLDLAECPVLGQRAGYLRADQGLFDRAGSRPAEEVLRWYESVRPEQGSILRRYVDRMHERFNELLPDAPAPIVVHSDVAPWNIKYQAGRLSGLLDFAGTHLDLRVADFVLSWRGRHDEVIRGYEEVSPLQPVERALIVPVYWAWQIACAVAEIEKGNLELDWEMRHLLRSDSELFAAAR